MNKIRKICIVVNSRANYARVKSVLKAVQKHPKLNLKLVVGASALLQKFGELTKIISKDGFKISAKLFSIIEGENLTTMAKSTGLGIIELSTIFENLKPDIVLTVADRFETMATAIAASYMNIPLAHTQGGEVTGSIDESVRHAITKLSHIHFPSSKKAYNNIIKLGENKKNLFLTGCPSMDLAVGIKKDLNVLKNYHGVGAHINLKKPYILVLQHPVTTEYQKTKFQIEQTIKAIIKLNIQTIWLWPNVDAGSDEISKTIRIYRERNLLKNVRFYKNFSPEDFLKIMISSKCIIGNSSSAIREGSFLGIPAVNIGNRQNGREHGDNIKHVNYNMKKILKAIIYQIKKGKYKKNKIFGNGSSGKKIAEILSKVKPDIIKKLSYE